MSAPNALRRHATTWILIALAVGVAVALWVLERGRATTAEVAARQGQLFPVWRKQELRRVELEVRGQRMVLVRDPGSHGELDFHMQQPVEGMIDAAAVDRLLSSLELATPVRSLPEEPANFGAIEATGTLQMGEQTLRFAIGGEVPVPQGARYLRLAGHGVVVMPEAFVHEVLADVSTYRSKQIVPYLSVELAGLTLQRPSGALGLQRLDPVAFRIVESGIRASRTRIDTIWSALAELRADAFPEASAAAQLQRPDVVVVEMRPEDGRPTISLRVGGVCPGQPESLLVQRDGPQPLLACAPRSVLEGFSVEADWLADQGAFSLRADEAEELAAKSESVRFDLAREGSGFRLRAEGGGRELSADELASFETSYRFLFGDLGKAVPAVKGGFVKSAELRVVAERGSRTETVELGRCAAPLHSACLYRTADQAWLPLDAAMAARWAPSEAWYRSGDLGLPKERAHDIQLDCGAPQRLQRVDAGYSLLQPSGQRGDGAGMLELADQLRRLRASGFIAGGADTGKLGFGACGVHITAKADDASSLRLEIGGRADAGTRFARLAGREGVFLIDAELYEAASRWWLDRSFWPESQPIEQLDWLHGLGAARVGGDDPLAVAVRDLRADSVLHRGPARAEEGLSQPWLRITASAGKLARTVTIGAPHRVADAAPSAPVQRSLRYSDIDATYLIDESRLLPLLQRGDAGTASVTPGGDEGPAPAP